VVNFKNLFGKAKDQVDKRGGTDALKDDLKEVGDAVKGEGSLKDKAKGAVDAVKDPGKNSDPGVDGDAK
jgi:hypothetical protein